MIRGMMILMIFCIACQSGQIPCPEVKDSKLKKTRISKRLRFAERVSMSKPSPNEHEASTRTTAQNTRPLRHVETKPVLEHVDVDEWDCPKPGMKNMPKAVKENIRKNTKKMRDYMRQRHANDSVPVMSSGRQGY